MNPIVVYQSCTGFTKQYAQWIAQDLQCRTVPLKGLSAKELAAYDTVIFGGWIMGGMIMGLEKLKKLVSFSAAVFATGSNPSNEELTETLRNQNKLGDIPFFYFEGGFHYDKLNFLQRMMLKMVKKSIGQKPQKTEQDLRMEQVLGTSFDHADKAQISPLVQHFSC